MSYAYHKFDTQSYCIWHTISKAFFNTIFFNNNDYYSFEELEANPAQCNAKVINP